MESVKEKEHFLALKVMRLTKPTLMMSQPIISEDSDFAGKVFQQIQKNNLSTAKSLENFSLGEFLTLPQNFGNIFLGETFSSYLSVHNDSSQTVKDILVKADLQTGSQRLTLSGSGVTPVPSLPSGQSLDEVVQHEVKELGTHILVCAVSYTAPTNEKMYFRKFFKFQVLKPLDVKTKFYNAETDEVFLEAQIQNITPGPIFMDRVNLDPSSHYSSTQLNSITDKVSDTGVFGKVNYMNPLDIRQYLYCLRPKTDGSSDVKLLKGVTNIGKLDIIWRTNMGQKGRLQTSPLQRVVPGYGDIKLSVESIPESVEVEQYFTIKFKVTNSCERTMELLLILLNNTSGIIWNGLSGNNLGKLTPNNFLLFELSLLAVKPGLQTISGLRFKDTFLTRIYEHDEIAQIFVYTHEE